ncbi:MAG: hypothetical protein IPM17_11905 [Verrucomicrobia bacterium]|nr:hypothetical protein [Verrucomicrobiota bacterium]
MSPTGQHFKAVAMLVLCTAFWSVSFPAMRALSLAQQAELSGASTWFISLYCTFVRFGLSALLILLPSLATLRRLTRLEIEQGLGMGLFGAAGIVLQMDGLAHVDASVSAFLTQSYCLLIPIWVAWRERRWPSVIVVVSCGLVILGVGVLSKVNWRELRLGRGELETLLASVFFTGQILWLQRPIYARNNVNHFSLVMFGVMAAAGAIGALFSTHAASHWAAAYSTGASWTFIAILVLFSTLGGYMLMNHWQPKLPATQAGLIYCAEPLFVSFMVLFLPAWFGRLAGVEYANETLDRAVIVGGGLITVANVLIQVEPWLLARLKGRGPLGVPTPDRS